MNLVRCVQISNTREAIHELGRVGVDATGIKLMSGKAIHFNLRVEGIDPRAANLLKQEMLSLGADAAVDKRGFDCSASETTAILMGTHKQFERIISKLESYPHLQTLTGSIRETVQNLLRTHFSLRCKRRTYTLGKRTLVMGVLNVTPDSFSDGGLYFDKETAVARGLRMFEEGADFLDVGGESTRPGSKPIELEEELRRVIPVIESLSKRLDIPLSIDTYKSAVAERAIAAGAEIINDISALNLDPALAQVASHEKVPLVLMHMRGTPETMQKDVHYRSLFSEILGYLKQSIQKAQSEGVDPEQIIVDPGIGFGKTVEDNLQILKHLSEFRILGKPILLGTSRKSFIGRILNVGTEERLEGSLSSCVIGAFNGAHIIRCHDVLQTKRAVAIADSIRHSEMIPTHP